jgi:hypothetical protein
LSAAARQNVFSSMTMAKAIMQQRKMETLPQPFVEYLNKKRAAIQFATTDNYLFQNTNPHYFFVYCWNLNNIQLKLRNRNETKKMAFLRSELRHKRKNLQRRISFCKKQRAFIYWFTVKIESEATHFPGTKRATVDIFPCINESVSFFKE